MRRQKRELSRIEHDRVEALGYFVRFAQGEYDGLELGRFVLRVLGRARLNGMDDEKRVSELRKWMLGGLKKMAAGKEWEIRSGEIGSFSIVHTPQRTHYEGGPAVAALLFSALLDGANWRLAYCAWLPCGKIFVRKGRGEYCSRKCSQQMRTRRHRDPGFRMEELRLRVHAAAVDKPRKQTGRANRRTIESAITPQDLARPRRLRNRIMKQKENTWATDIAEVDA
jgi:hypothetical protein